MRKIEVGKTIQLIANLGLIALVSSCGGGSSSGSSQNVAPVIPTGTSVTASCIPAAIQRLGTSQCSASVLGTGNIDSSVMWSADGGTIDSSGMLIGPADAGSVTITATSVGEPSVSGQTVVVVASDRAVSDLADDQSGYQIHVLYVVASNGMDRALDTDGTIALSVESWNAWLSTQTGGIDLRLDTANGALDITFVRLNRSDAQMNAYGAQIRDQLETELATKGFDVSNKLYLVYYDGGGAQTPSCGGGAYPPSLPGTVAALYLNGMPSGSAPCSTNPFATAVDSPGYIEFVGIHEVMHVLGFVPSCSPNETAAGHVFDDNIDVMYAGPLAWNPIVLDVNRDDYYEANAPNCIDFADSAFLSPLPATPQPPPGWPYEMLSTISCADEALLQSTAGDQTTIQFINGTDAPVNVYRLDFSGTRQFRRTLGPYEGFLAATFTTHPWVITDATNQCLSIFRGSANMGRAIARSN